MFKQTAIVLGFVSLGAFFITIMCNGFFSYPLNEFASGSVSIFWGLYVATRAISSGAFQTHG